MAAPGAPAISFFISHGVSAGQPILFFRMDAELKRRLKAVRDRFLILRSDRERAKERLEALVRERDETVRNIDLRVEAINFVEGVAAQERVSVKERVERLVTSCLNEVYGEGYSVEFEYGMRGNKTSVEISVVRRCADGMEVHRGIDGIGGGVADTVALPLKLIVLMNDEGLDKVLITDEPGKHLDTTRVNAFAKFIGAVAHELGVQVIMSSHWEVMREEADRVHRVTLEDSVARVERIK